MWKFLLWLAAKIIEWFLRKRRPKPKPRKGFLMKIALWLFEKIKEILRRRRR